MGSRRGRERMGWPRASRDIPSAAFSSSSRSALAPREQGYPPTTTFDTTTAPVGPARAGIYPGQRRCSSWRMSWPRASRDIPIGEAARMLDLPLAQREQGSTTTAPGIPSGQAVRPAQAGTCPARPHTPHRIRRKPSASRDIPMATLAWISQFALAPRKQGYTRPEIGADSYLQVGPTQAVICRHAM